MKLYLVVALVVLALVAFTEAQEVEPVAETDKIVQFGEQVSEIGQDIAKKTKAAFQNIQDSEFATTSRVATSTAQEAGGFLLDFAEFYYYEHIRPTTHWASAAAGSLWNRVQKTVDNYRPWQSSQSD
ncbi:hypothetical protein NHX12_001904 [Muraenolepis orangiensis]|uniref:Uncharacterized protein n=1 Tax=Muraenolepis orangiensis TaxID=630683 RepID=A0A9Q0E1M4_9TELE|nr:hypothetical protein NHX12_001904 [Muraenolepis orangiensis]